MTKRSVLQFVAFLKSIFAPMFKQSFYPNRWNYLRQKLKLSIIEDNGQDSILRRREKAVFDGKHILTALEVGFPQIIGPMMRLVTQTKRKKKPEKSSVT